MNDKPEKTYEAHRINYEEHKINNDLLPFVFHKDTVRKYDGYDIANWHRNVEILYFTEGVGTAVCDANMYDVSPGDIIVVNSNSIHYVRTMSKVKYYCLIIDADFCESNGISTDEAFFTNLIRDKSAQKKYERVIQEYATRGAYYSAGIRCGVLDLLIYIARGYAQEKVSYVKSTAKPIENMKHALGYINTHYTEQLTIDDIAGEVNLSKYHFSRQFKKNTGLTPVSYINMLRCEMAKKLLAEGNKTVGEVQERCGFENASYFTKVFRKFSGTTPAAYAEKSKK